MRAALIATVLAVSTAASPAVAQTAEETVAYILAGMADGATPKYMDFIQTRQISDSPAVFESGNRANPPWRYVVTRLEDCLYAYSQGAPGQNPVVRKVDFSRVSDWKVEPYGQTLDVDPDGLRCEIDGKWGACRRYQISLSHYSTSDDGPRMNRAIAYFRERFCAGRAF